MSAPHFEKHPVFKAGTYGYHCYRIPALILTAEGTLMAFAEARQRNCSDWTHSAIVGRRCLDPVNHLDHWEEPFIVKESQRLITPRNPAEILNALVVAKEKGWNPASKNYHPKIDIVTNNPVPIVDQDGTTIHLVYCENYDSAFYTKSTDDGITWAPSVNITPVLEQLKGQYDWTVIASGPGQGLQLQRGKHARRLIVPFWLAADRHNPTAHHPSQVATLYSDDQGASWQAGEFVPFTINSPNETKAVQLTDGRVLLNSRSRQPLDKAAPDQHRVTTHSTDGATNWTQYQFDPTLPEPMCMGSLIRYSHVDKSQPPVFLFSAPNPVELNHKADQRINLTVWLSEDECQSWPISKTAEPMDAAYSDLAVDPENELIYLLYEGGFKNAAQGAYAGQTIAKFNLEWLTEIN